MEILSPVKYSVASPWTKLEKIAQLKGEEGVTCPQDCHLSKVEQHFHTIYERVDDKDRDIIDRAYSAVVHVLREMGDFQPAGDDRAEALVSAIMRYVVESYQG
jgi:hypothetical protein